jgi:hypothetical protein
MKRILLLFFVLGVFASLIQAQTTPKIYSRWSGRVVICSDTLNLFKTYQWYQDNTTAIDSIPHNFSPIAGATGQYYAVEGGLNGYYYVMVTTINGSTLTSDTLSLHTHPASSDVSMYPNPIIARSSVFIETIPASVQMAKISIYTMSGILVQQYTTSSASTSIEAPSEKGCYLVRIQLESGDITTRKLLVR